VENLLQRHFEGRMVLNPSKSKLTTIGRKVKALGLVILPTGRVTIDMELKKKIEVLLHFYSTDTPKFVRFAGCSDYEGAVGKVSGYLNYVNANDQRYLEKLRGKFGATIVDSFIHKTVS
jgi:RNA-directed DNA polymerase